MHTIGIDIGTTTISLILVSHPELTMQRVVTLPNDAFLSTGRPWERIQDVSAIVSRATEALKEMVAEESDIAAIGLTGQMHGILYVDKTGAAVSPLYTWQDGRGNLPDFEKGKSVCDFLSGQYGVRAASGYGLVTHLYNVKKSLVPAGAASLCTIADYLGMALTGRRSPLLHASQAASLGLYDCGTKDFLRDILEENGVPASFLPPVLYESAPMGRFCGIPVHVSIGDNQASFLGSVGNRHNCLLVNIGTGSQISLLSDTCFQGKGIEVRPFTADSYLLVGAALCGGRAFAALERFFRTYAVAAGAKDQPQYEIMKTLLEQARQSGETMDLQVRTTFSGTRENPADAGSISGIRLDNFHPAALVEGVLKGMAQELYELYRVIENGTGIRAETLFASGNGVRRNPALRDILQNRFGMALRVVEHEEEAALGAAISPLTMKVTSSS